MTDWFAIKSFDQIFAEAANTGEHSLKRSLGAGALIAIGVGATVGVGVFVLTGIVSARYAGPAVVLSFLLASLACLLVGLCYAELASMIPIAGSAYTYSYATLGETFAWIVGWDLVLEYTFGAATVGQGWSGYLTSLLRNFGVALPPSMSGTRWDDFVFYGGRWELTSRILPMLQEKGIDPLALTHTHGAFNVVAFLVVSAIVLVLIIGVRESASVNGIVVIATVFVLLFFVAVGARFLLIHPELRAAHWHPFIPPNAGFGKFGWSGVGRGAAYLMFAYLGFDAVSTSAQEAKNPQRDVAIGVFGSLGITALLYVAFATVLVGLVSYKNLDVGDPLSLGVDTVGLHWSSLLVTVGALGALTSTLYVMLLGATRLLYSMSTDGLIPKSFGRVHPQYRTPYFSTLCVGVFVAILASVLSIDVMAAMVSIGTMLAFAAVCVGVLFLRWRKPEMPRGFRAPGMPFVPIAALAVITIIAINLAWVTWGRLFVWLAIGLLIYFFYGRQHSHLQLGKRNIPRLDALGRSDHADDRRTGSALGSRAVVALLTVFVTVIAVAALLAVLSIYFPVIEREFQAAALLLGIAAIVLGLLTSVLPSLRALWSINSESLSFDDDTDRDVRELIEKLRGRV